MGYENYCALREGVRRTLKLAEFVQAEAKLTTTTWFYNIESDDKKKLLDLHIKVVALGEDFVKALDRFCNAVNEMTTTSLKRSAKKYGQE